LSICPRELAKTEAFERSRQSGSEMLFAHLKRILRLGRLRLRGPRGAQFEFTLAAIAQNLSRLAKLIGQHRQSCLKRERPMGVGTVFDRFNAAVSRATSVTQPRFGPEVRGHN
jgi:hypothetical protein